MNIKQANEIVGGLSNPSKMPGYGYSLPAAECLVGSRLREVKGSVCEGCYAMKGRYVFPVVQDALYRRLDSVMRDARWEDAMVLLINRRAAKHPYFRWHDSGDLQSVEHLERIARVARRTKAVRHWLPTREYQIVRRWLNTCPDIPDNLTIRLSAHQIGERPPQTDAWTTSTVDYNVGYQCPAPEQGNNCGDCRACWSPDVQNVNYHKH